MTTSGLYGVIADNEHYIIYQGYRMLPHEHPARLIAAAACIADENSADRPAHPPEEEIPEWLRDAARRNKDREMAYPPWESLAEELQHQTSFVDFDFDHNRNDTSMVTWLRMQLEGLLAPEVLASTPDNHLTLLCRPGSWIPLGDGEREHYVTIPSFTDMSIGTIATVSDPQRTRYPNGASISVIADLDRGEMVISEGTEDGWHPVRSILLDDRKALHDACMEFAVFKTLPKNDQYQVLRHLKPSFCGGTPRTLADPSLTAGGAIRRAPWLPALPFSFVVQESSPWTDPVMEEMLQEVEQAGSSAGTLTDSKTLKEQVRQRKREGRYTNKQIARQTGASPSQVARWTLDIPNAPRRRKRNQ